VIFVIPQISLMSIQERKLIDIADKQALIIREFRDIPEWKERYRRIIDRAAYLPPLPEECRIEKLLVKGCQNRAWLHADFKEGRVEYVADSESQIVKGLVALLIELYSGHSPDEILSTPPIFIQQLNLGENLTVNRANGLASMVSHIKRYALAFKLLSEQRKEALNTQSKNESGQSLTSEMLKRVSGDSK
jgi:cysteine desulfuration protein SufE